MQCHYFPRLKLIFSKYLIDSKDSERFTSSFPHRAFDRGAAARAGGRQGQAETAGGEEVDEEDGLRSGQRCLE